jgi:chromosome partitioning protein
VGQTIACANQKGGVGKTTTVVNLSTYLALAGERVLVVDLDPQCNATSGFGISREAVRRSVYEGIIDGVDVRELLSRTPIAGLSIVPSAVALAGAEVELTSIDQRERQVRRFLRPVVDDFDYVLIDCPPALGLLTLNALTAADTVLIPLQTEYYALEGLTQLVATLDLVRAHLNPRLRVKGVVLTMYDARTNLSADVASEARRHLGDAVFGTIIPRSVRLSEAPSHGLPIALYRPGSPGADAYRALAEELRRRDHGDVGMPQEAAVPSANEADRSNSYALVES